LFWLVDTLCIPDCTCLQVEKHREDLLHKHAREMERLRDASVRLKEEYEHKMELERLFFSVFTSCLLATFYGQICIGCRH